MRSAVLNITFDGDLGLSGTGEERQRRGLPLIGYAFAALAAYLLVQSTVVLANGYHPITAIHLPATDERQQGPSPGLTGHDRG
jgi:hypothetical protein